VERFRSSIARTITLGLAACFVIAASHLAGAETKPAATNAALPDPDANRVQRFLEDRVRRDPDDIIAQNRLAEIYLQRMRETGGYEWLQRAREAARRSLASVPAEQNATGLFMEGRVEYESHHFATARDRALALTKIEPNKSRGFALLGDALLEFGDLDEAAAAYQKMQARSRDPIEMETRLARLDLARGAFDSARERFERALAAARELSPPQPEIVTWCLLQSGQLAFKTGQWETAEKFFHSALVALPDYPRTLDHLGELRAAQEKYEEAISLYQKVIERMPRPEFWQAIGEVYAAMGRSADAAIWYARARAGYLENVREGNAHYFHHLADFFSDVEEDSAEAIKWARKDLELRQSVGAKDALAWALYRAGEFESAAGSARAAIAGGSKDAHLLYHAGTIFLAAGDPTLGNELLAEAARVNPRHRSFHVHR
jgi:tetratricopeptide (TPR) repeat protein